MEEFRPGVPRPCQLERARQRRRGKLHRARLETSESLGRRSLTHSHLSFPLPSIPPSVSSLVKFDFDWCRLRMSPPTCDAVFAILAATKLQPVSLVGNLISDIDLGHRIVNERAAASCNATPACNSINFLCSVNLWCLPLILFGCSRLSWLLSNLD